MNSEGSLVLFYLLDKHLKARSHFAMCAVPCRDIPKLSQTSLKMSLSDPIAPQRKNFSLPMFQFSSESLPLLELVARADSKDASAIRFMKMNELLLGNMSSNSPKFVRNRNKTVE